MLGPDKLSWQSIWWFINVKSQFVHRISHFLSTFPFFAVLIGDDSDTHCRIWQNRYQFENKDFQLGDDSDTHCRIWQNSYQFENKDFQWTDLFTRFTTWDGIVQSNYTYVLSSFERSVQRCDLPSALRMLWMARFDFIIVLLIKRVVPCCIRFGCYWWC